MVKEKEEEKQKEKKKKKKRRKRRRKKKRKVRFCHLDGFDLFKTIRTCTKDQPMIVDSESIISIGDENKEVDSRCRGGIGRCHECKRE